MGFVVTEQKARQALRVAFTNYFRAIATLIGHPAGQITAQAWSVDGDEPLVLNRNGFDDVNWRSFVSACILDFGEMSMGAVTQVFPTPQISSIHVQPIDSYVEFEFLSQAKGREYGRWKPNNQKGTNFSDKDRRRSPVR